MATAPVSTPSDVSNVTDPSTPNNASADTVPAAAVVDVPESAPKTEIPAETAPAPAPSAESPVPASAPVDAVETASRITTEDRPVRARTPLSRPNVPAARRSSMSRSSGQGSGQGRQGRNQNSGRSDRQDRDRNDRGDRGDRLVSPVDRADGALKEIKGFIDLTVEGHAVVREGFSQSRNDAYLSIAMVRRLGIRAGDVVTGTAREPRENDRYWGLKDITSINGLPLEESRRRRRFEDLVPVYPTKKLVMETGKEPISTRLIDLVAPIGKGQRGLIVSPPKAGKTTIMKEISTGIAANFPEVHLMAVLIGERPEEVTDIARHITAITEGRGETAASNFDEPATEQTRVAEVALERAKRLVEAGQDVVIVMDSITRLARAYNLAIPTSGRTLSGGFDPAALYPPKRFFGAARNFEEGGSLTIIATALVDTGSRMDDLVYEEFKGTGNMELHLDRRIAERRIYPAINLQRSGTRHDDLLFSSEEYQSVVMMHRMIDMLGEEDRTPMVVRRLKETNTNKQFLASLKEG